MKAPTRQILLLSLSLSAGLLAVPAHAEEVSQTLPAPELKPVRSVRRIALLGELGWNGLAGTGVNVVGNITKNFALDFGGGFGLAGPKLGLRARYNFLDTVVTPYVAAGVTQTFRSSNFVTISDPKTGEAEDFHLAASTAVQGTVGLDYTSRSGFMLLAYAGYSYSVGGSALRAAPAARSSEMERTLATFYGSGAVAGVALGYAF